MYDSRLRGLGGWLLVVELGLIGTLIRVISLLVQTYLPIYTEGYWAQLTDPSSDAYHFLWAPLLTFEILGNLALMAMAAVGLILFFRRSRAFPRLMVVYYLGGLVFVGLDFFASRHIPAVAAEGDLEGIAELLGLFLYTCIWVPYMYRSRRVRKTFTEPSNEGATASTPANLAA